MSKVTYKPNQEVKEEALYHIQQLGILIDHLYRENPAEAGSLGVTLDGLKEALEKSGGK